MKTELTFEKLPSAVQYLIAKIETIEQLLSTQNRVTNVQLDTWMNIDELMEYLPDKPAKATVYGWVSAREIPHNKGKSRLRFLKSEIDKWLSDGKRKTEDELQQEAEVYLKAKKSGKY